MALWLKDYLETQRHLKCQFKYTWMHMEQGKHNEKLFLLKHLWKLSYLNHLFSGLTKMTNLNSFTKVKLSPLRKKQ